MIDPARHWLVRPLSGRARLILAVAIVPLGWPVATLEPQRGLDASWSAALSLALQHGLRFGHAVDYTYGPLAFMSPPTLWWRPTSVAGALMVFAVTALLAWLVLKAAGDAMPAIPALVTAYVVMCVAAIAEPAETLGIVICLAALLAVQRELRGLWLTVLPTALGVATAIALLVKFDAGVEALLVTVVVCGWLGTPRWRSFVQYVLSLLVALGLLWLCVGQRLADLPTWLWRSWEIARGYSVAMASYPPNHVPELVIVLVFLPTGMLAARLAHRRQAWIVWWVVAVLVFFQWKHGVVRYQAGGPYLAAVALPAAIVWQNRARWLALGVPALLALYLLTLAPPAHLDRLTLSPVPKVSDFSTEAGQLLSSSSSSRVQQRARARLRDLYRIPPAVLSALRGRRVFVDPYEVTAAWAYGLRWQPVPVFQRFSAYLPSLDSANSAFLTSAEGPDDVLFQVHRGAIDGRNLLWDSPKMELAIACHFASTAETNRWQVWSRVSPRCGATHVLGKAVIRNGRPVTVPTGATSGTIMFARVSIPTSIGAGLEQLLYKPTCPASVTAGTRDYRLVPATAADGLILSAPSSAPFGEVQPPPSLTFRCLPGSLAHVVFVAMDYREAPSSAAARP